MGDLAGWLFLGGFLLLILVFVAAAQFAFAVRQPREAAHEPSGRGASAARQSDPAPRLGLGAVVGVAAGKVVNSIEDMKGGYARARGYDTMSSYEDGDNDPLASAAVFTPEKQKRETGNAESPARNDDDTPEYIIPAERLKALETLYKGGLTALDIERLQEGEAGVIKLANKVAPRRVIAKAMGGGTKRRMDEIAAALEQGVGDE